MADQIPKTIQDKIELSTREMSREQIMKAANIYKSIEEAKGALLSFKKDDPVSLKKDGHISTKTPIAIEDRGDVSLPVPGGDSMCPPGVTSQFKLGKSLGITGELKELLDPIMEPIEAVTDFVNQIYNIASAIPEIVKDVADIFLSDYVDYLNNEIQILELMIKKKINEILVFKNKLMLRALKKSRNGISSATDALVGGALTAINTIVDGINVALQAFDAAYMVAYKTLVNTMIPWLLNQESMSFFFTPRSLFMRPGTFVIPHATMNMNQSVVEVMNYNTLEKLSSIGFPKIQDWEYFMDPKLFDIRKKFSELNCKGLYDLVSLLELLLYTGAEPLPRYSRVKITNPYYLIYLFTGWAPAGITCFGIPGFP